MLTPEEREKYLRLSRVKSRLEQAFAFPEADFDDVNVAAAEFLTNSLGTRDEFMKLAQEVSRLFRPNWDTLVPAVLALAVKYERQVEINDLLKVQATVFVQNFIKEAHDSLLPDIEAGTLTDEEARVAISAALKDAQKSH